jgi:hypothetical protein
MEDSFFLTGLASERMTITNVSVVDGGVNNIVKKQTP